MLKNFAFIEEMRRERTPWRNSRKCDRHRSTTHYRAQHDQAFTLSATFQHNRIVIYTCGRATHPHTDSRMHGGAPVFCQARPPIPAVCPCDIELRRLTATANVAHSYNSPPRKEQTQVRTHAPQNAISEMGICLVWTAWDRPGSQTPRRSCGSALDPRFRIWNSSTRKVQTGTKCRGDRAGTAKTVDETWEGRRWDGERWHAHCKAPWATRVRDGCTARKENVSEKCACDTECVYTPRRTHSCCQVRNPETKKTQTSSCHFHLDFSHQDVVHQFAFHRSSLVNASRFPEACASSDFRWCHCVELKPEIRFTATYHFQLWESQKSQSSFSGSFWFLNLTCFFVHAYDSSCSPIVLERLCAKYRLFWCNPNIRTILSSNYVRAGLHEILHRSGSGQGSPCRFPLCGSVSVNSLARKWCFCHGWIPWLAPRFPWKVIKASATSCLNFCPMLESISTDMFSCPPHGHTWNPASMYE